MAKRAVLEKMSNKELLQYFRPDTRFVAEALDLAYDILEKRNYPFAEQERSRIIHLIETKRDAERDLHLKSTWDIGEDAEKGQISFYSQTAIWILGILFGTLAGSILLAINLFKVSKSRALLTILFGILYLCILFVVNQITQLYVNDFVSRLVFIVLNIIGVIILQNYFWKKYLTGIIYRKRNATVPLVLCVIFSLVLYAVSISLQNSESTEVIYHLK